MLLVERGARNEEQCIKADETLLIRIGNKMLLVWRYAPQDKEHIEKDEMLLVERGAQKEEQYKTSVFSHYCRC